MKVIEITEIEVKAALDVAKSEEVKNVLVALFCKGEKKPTPTLDDYTTIRSYEDACAALKCSPIDEKALLSLLILAKAESRHTQAHSRGRNAYSQNRSPHDCLERQ